MMKRLLVSALVLSVILPSTASAFKLERTWERIFPVDEGARFVLKNVNGNIEVSSWNESAIGVEALITIKAPSTTKAEELFDKIEFLVEEKDGYLGIEADLPRVRRAGFLFGDHISISVRYEVKVPRRTDLDLSSVNGGIEAEGVKGRFDIRTTNGSIALRGMEGEGDLETVNGGVKCQLVEFFEGGRLAIETTNGGVRLDLPDGVGGSLEAKTVNGGIDLDMPLSKSIAVRRRSISGILGDGGGSIMVRTTNGSISIE